MSTVEEMLKYMETPEGKAKTERWIKEYINKEELKQENIRSIMSNTDYINWLYHFSKDKEGFCDDDWLYCPDEINKEDLDNVEKLSHFYEGVEKYARENHIYPTPCNFGNYYRVKLNSFSFRIGILVGQGTVFFFKKESAKDKGCINFNDILMNKKQDNVDQINDTLDSISDMIINAYESGVPVEAIVNTFESTINNITSKQEDKAKRLVIE